VKAHEYEESPETLRQKVKMMASLIKKADHFLAYTGAGISTASGIKDYASKSKQSVAVDNRSQKKASGLDAQPTYAHFTMAALYNEGYLKHWVQQNHDGLPQKAGYPQANLNEIHGAWFNPSNPVVPMSGSLRDDLFDWMNKEEEEADLVLAMGTSLSGMNADRMVSTPAKKYLKKKKGYGAIIIGFQQTKMDKLASLRIFARIDEVMKLLVEELELEINTSLYRPDIPHEAKTDNKHVFRVPYDPVTGEKTENKTALWDLREGAKIKLTDGPGKGFVGRVTRVPASPTEHYSVSLPNTREGKDLGQGKKAYRVGCWWAESCAKGQVPKLPFINIPK
jgi:NAD-dependent SIR2 family protein deacetylase